MTLDSLDHAFIARFAFGAAVIRPPQAAGDGLARRAVGTPTPDPTAEVLPEPADVRAQPRNPGSASEALVTRLLQAAAGQWSGLAAEVEGARRSGHRVIAITGGERGEGRTTLVACLTAALRARHRDVTVCDPHDLATCDDGVVGGGQLHDQRIVLVDAGIWFPPGPVRRERLLVASFGCDAAIIVRRAARPSVPGWGVALAAVGVEPLGEVVTFAAAHGVPDGAVP